MEREEKFSGKKMRQVTSKDFKHLNYRRRRRKVGRGISLWKKGRKRGREEGMKRIAAS